MNTDSPDHSRKYQAVAAWVERAGLQGIAETLKEAFSPLSPLAAQTLWLVQPMFGLFGEYDLAGQIAEKLYNPDSSDTQAD